MANGTPDFTMGELTAKTNNLDKRVTGLEKEIAPLMDAAAQIRGAVGMLKWIVSVAGLTTIVNVVISVSHFVK